MEARAGRRGEALLIVVPLTGFSQRVDSIEKMLQPIGEVTVEDLASDRARTLSFRAEAPGYGLPRLAVFQYRELYRRVVQGWSREQYLYEYRPDPAPSRRAHHDHPPRGVHQHCREAARPEAHAHYEDRPRLLEEAHEEFTRLYLDAASIDCGGLRPLR